MTIPPASWTPNGPNLGLFYDANGNITSPGNVTVASAANFAPAQVVVGNTSTLIAALRIGRASVTVENNGATAVYLGNATVSVTTGVLLPGVLGASITLPTSAAVYGVVASGNQTVSKYELY